MVEHDEDCIRAADYLIDIGPGAGAHGGHVVCAGPVPEVFDQRAKRHDQVYDRRVRHRRPRRTASGRSATRLLELKGCRENNLKNVDVRIPLGGLICVTGVSGSGKSTLINQTLLPALKRKLYSSKVKAGDAQVAQRREQDRQGHRDRPKPHRPHTAMQSGDLYRRLR